MWERLVAAASEPFVGVGASGPPVDRRGSPSVPIPLPSKYSRRSQVAIEKVARREKETVSQEFQPETRRGNFAANDAGDELDGTLVEKPGVSGDRKTSLSGRSRFRLPVSDAFSQERSALVGRVGDGSMGYCGLSFETFARASQICSAFSSVLDISQFALVY